MSGQLFTTVDEDILSSSPGMAQLPVRLPAGHPSHHVCSMPIDQPDHTPPDSTHAPPNYSYQVLVHPMPSTAGPPISHTSLPSYRLLPQSAEAILLLAPPPRYCHCTCDAESQIHAHDTCGRRATQSRAGDLVVTTLIVLNVLLWAAVVWGFYTEWTPVTGEGYEDLGGVVFLY